MAGRKRWAHPWPLSDEQRDNDRMRAEQESRRWCLADGSHGRVGRVTTGRRTRPRSPHPLTTPSAWPHRRGRSPTVLIVLLPCSDKGTFFTRNAARTDPLLIVGEQPFADEFPDIWSSGPPFASAARDYIGRGKNIAIQTIVGIGQSAHRPRQDRHSVVTDWRLSTVASREVDHRAPVSASSSPQCRPARGRVVASQKTSLRANGSANIGHPNHRNYNV